MNIFLAQATPQGGTINFVVMLVIMGAIFYFMLILPQKRKDKERRKMIDNTKTGDRVIFSGGIIGTVANVKDNVIVVKVADNTKIEVLKGAIVKVLEKGAEPTDAETK